MSKSSAVFSTRSQWAIHLNCNIEANYIHHKIYVPKHYICILSVRGTTVYSDFKNHCMKYYMKLKERVVSPNFHDNHSLKWSVQKILWSVIVNHSMKWSLIVTVDSDFPNSGFKNHSIKWLMTQPHHTLKPKRPYFCVMRTSTSGHKSYF